MASRNGASSPGDTKKETPHREWPINLPCAGHKTGIMLIGGTRITSLPYKAPDSWPDKIQHIPAVLLAQFIFATFMMAYLAALALFAVRLKPKEYIFTLPALMYVLTFFLALSVLACGTMDLAFWLIAKPTVSVNLTVLGWL